MVGVIARVIVVVGRASATRSATANDSCASSRPPWGLGAVAQHFWSKETGKVVLPWGRGAYVGVDLCGRLQPLSQKVESKRNRPHPVPPQDAVDYSLNDPFERLEFDLRENIVFLFVDGRTNPLKHKLDSARVQDKQAEAKAVLQWAEQARADQPENQGLTAADWSDRRDKIKAAQKTIAHYDGTFFAMVQD